MPREHLVKFKKEDIDPNGFVTVPQAARLIGYDEKTIYGWIRQGRLHGVAYRCGFGRSVRLKAAAFLDWVDVHFTQISPPRLK